ncbi:MAG: uroporphyrinogen-III C-methyltransferase [Burkholderiales bacterium]|nr:uroporphyrinogen-III C-methyltransferase [Burkholderiales bacterium]
MKTGKVYLIGAGPGDIELLTLKAVRALGIADLVLIDDLVNPQVLDFLRRGARVIDVGKRGGQARYPQVGGFATNVPRRCRSTPQEFIERLMIAEAKAGCIVARVKGGDPFVFGRGGEEVLALRAAGIDIEVVSGITAGIAAPAALGIPVTHRDYTHGVIFVTGHSGNGDEPDWRALAKCGMTLVIYMGVARLAKITSALLAAGLPATTPAAAIQNGTLAAQKQVLANLGNLSDAVRHAQLASPAIIVVGKVVDLAQVALIAARQAA